MTSSLSEVETDSQSDVVDLVVGSSSSSLSEILTGDLFYTWTKADTGRARQLC